MATNAILLLAATLDFAAPGDSFRAAACAALGEAARAFFLGGEGFFLCGEGGRAAFCEVDPFGGFACFGADFCLNAALQSRASAADTRDKKSRSAGAIYYGRLLLAQCWTSRSRENPWQSGGASIVCVERRTISGRRSQPRF